ncbi:oxygen-insensitive NADPH nitroreductase [Bacillus sp. ISL-40]|uniref:oxygen-insensitive NADPH nitroreductase n=1 Tax=unclassified Bacillus (in: firmicutes) TaxID=185979 RepID=UPI001BE8985D|nr:MULTISPECIES: oxygen-insensitive NADPH nitroreductase [unclassified Bacillus (in: firmicutes)]MBT2700246.1 oxygen-insensitive NADPH nitroreductase [Bacillus sp. ISL-40]MBT2722846.1 oxygen-insensitive NADPH nitroreductase [Bacillus sp. ISL-46]MBT2740531.1 oxygen-insensitive NADPH nitroreductase [Bacillus sp. ISL-77]
MNEVINTILNHRSLRHFEDKPLTDEQIKTIVTSAQAAATSSFIQAYSIIGVKDKEKKKKLAEIAGNQEYVEKNGHFFVFCADLYRHTIIGEKEQKDVTPSIESTEKFMVALIDASLAAQNAAIAAESLGLGICYIGGIRNNLEEVKKLLKTPERVIPLFGLAVGVPTKLTDKKPRLPYEHVYHEDEYQQSTEVYLSQLQKYDDLISCYYEERTNGKRKDRWTDQIATMLDRKSRMYMKEFVQKNKLNLK